MLYLFKTAHLGNGIMGACLQAPYAAHLDSDKWRHFILNISSPSGKWCDPLFLV